MASSLGNLGVVARLEGHLDEARRLTEECLALRQRLGDRWAWPAPSASLERGRAAAG